jgi:hypothetical protein
VVVDEAGRLHEGVGHDRADEPEAPGPQVFGHGFGLGRRARHLGQRGEPRRVGRPAGSVRPDDVDQRLAGLVQRQDRPGVGDRRLDLGPVADDALVAQQPGHVGLAVGRHPVGLEPVERGPEARALAQDQRPRQPGLERLEAHQLEQPPLVPQRPAPLVVVVGDVARVAARPAAPGPAVFAHHEVFHVVWHAADRNGRV